MTKKRVVFMGSPPFAVPSLRALAEAGHEIVAVYTQPARPAGRGQKEQKTAVHMAAEELGVTVRTPERLREAALDEVLALEADVFCVVGFGMLLPKALVEARVCVNVHPSALPRWRGATPVQSALMAGDKTTEVCIMRLEEGMDTGPVYDRTGVEIAEDMDTAQLNDIVWSIGAKRLVYVVENLDALKAVAQVGEATRAVKITAQTRPVDWRKTAWEVHNQVRALAPAPGATAEIGGEVVKVLRTEVVDKNGDFGQILAVDAAGMVVACGAGAVRIVTLQRAGKRAMPAAEVARGWEALAAGKCFKAL
ncbi:MAG: methionyl-tRNA formyltransferase [Proteobacteria bacterium]|nr:methionyl-tRNA formyltransferase [Pseudomonadota bacterium]